MSPLAQGQFLNAEGAVQAFAPGWTPEHEKQGLDRFAESGRTFASADPIDTDTRPLPDGGFSLSSFVRWAYQQGQCGSCFANMGAAVEQVMMVSAEINGATRKAFNPSRRLIWHQCRKLDGSLGWPQDGGSIVNTFVALGDPPHGIGDCPEELWPYRADHRWLEQSPPEQVLQVASETRVEQIARLDYDRQRWQRLIFNTRPIGIGIWWPFGWDSECDSYGRTTGVGSGTFGHALAVIGWAQDWDGYFWWEILNSHGPIYGIPPADVQRRLLGYRPTAGERSHSFWCREDHFRRVIDANAEFYCAADVRGFEPIAVNLVPSMLETFPV